MTKSGCQAQVQPVVVQANSSSANSLGPDLQGVSSIVDPEETSADPTDSSSSRSLENYRCMAVVSPEPQCPRVTRQSIQFDTARVGRGSQSNTAQHGTSSMGPPRSSPIIGVPVDRPLIGLGPATLSQASRTAVRKLEEGSFTPNVEELLATLSGPLEVVHNVAPSGVRKHLAKWRSAAKSELDTFDNMSVVRKFFGSEARAILRDPKIEVIPGKAVCTVKPGDPYKRKFRIVSCGNFAKTTAESQLYAGGAGAESLRTLLVYAGRRGRRAYGLDVKSAFLLASIPTNVTKRYARRPPRLLVDLELCTEDEVWMIDKALYGFRESPKWWSDHRDRFLSGASWESTPNRSNKSEKLVCKNITIS